MTSGRGIKKLEESCVCAVHTETVTHSERFVMKEDVEGMHFNGEGESDGIENSRSPSLPPAASICQHWLCSRAELMPTCCTQMVSICIDVWLCFTFLYIFLSFFLLFSDITAACDGPQRWRMMKLGQFCHFFILLNYLFGEFNWIWVQRCVCFILLWILFWLKHQHKSQ